MQKRVFKRVFLFFETFRNTNLEISLFRVMCFPDFQTNRLHNFIIQIIYCYRYIAVWMLTVVTTRSQVSISLRNCVFTIIHARAEIYPRFFVSKATNHENAEVDGNSEDSVIDDATEDYWASSGSGPDEDDSPHNETREALTHEASDHDTVSHASPICFALRIYLLKFMVDITQEVSLRSVISLFRYPYFSLLLSLSLSRSILI